MKKFLISIIWALCVGAAFASGENVATSKAFVDTAVAQKQDKIPANSGAAQVLTNTGEQGAVGTKDIYDSSVAYVDQTDSLIDAATMNAAVQNAIEAEFECVSWVDNDPTKDCLLVEIRGAIEQPKLPTGYTALEYIESTGTQYIYTGLTVSPIGLKTEVKLRLTTNSTAEQAIIGFDNGSGYEVYFIGTRIGTYNSSGNSAYITDIPGVTYTITSEMNNNGISQEVNGHRTSSAWSPSGHVTDGRNLYLFNLLYGYFISARAYYIKIWKDGSLVRDFVPARQDSDGEIGMYDLVSNRFFTNSGTGNFIGGPVANRYLPSGN